MVGHGNWPLIPDSISKMSQEGRSNLTNDRPLQKAIGIRVDPCDIPIVRDGGSNSSLRQGEDSKKIHGCRRGVDTS